MGLCFLWASTFEPFSFLSCDNCIKNLLSNHCSSHFSLTFSIRTEFRLWFLSMFLGGWCTTLSTANLLLRSRQNTTWTNATNTSWPRRSLINQIIMATSATWWFPGPSLIRSAQGYVLSHRFTLRHEFCTHKVNGSCRRFSQVECSLFGNGLREWWSWPRSTWRPTGVRSEEASLLSSEFYEPLVFLYLSVCNVWLFQADIWFHWKAAPPPDSQRQTEWNIPASLQWLWDRRHHHRIRFYDRQ